MPKRILVVENPVARNRRTGQLYAQVRPYPKDTKYINVSTYPPGKGPIDHRGRKGGSFFRIQSQNVEVYGVEEEVTKFTPVTAVPNLKHSCDQFIKSYLPTNQFPDYDAFLEDFTNFVRNQCE